MSRHFAKLSCLAIGALAGWLVRVEIAEVFTDPPWLSWAVGAGVLVVAWLVLYFALARPLFELIGDRLSAATLRVRATRTGTGLDEVPSAYRAERRPSIPPCAYCGGPGGPVCERCHARLTAEKR